MWHIKRNLTDIVRRLTRKANWRRLARSTNAPDHHNTTGHRFYVKAGVNQVKKFCKERGLHPKKIRASANDVGWTEVIHTENPRWAYSSIFNKFKEHSGWEIK